MFLKTISVSRRLQRAKRKSRGREENAEVDWGLENVA